MQHWSKPKKQGVLIPEIDHYPSHTEGTCKYPICLATTVQTASKASAYVAGLVLKVRALGVLRVLDVVSAGRSLGGGRSVLVGAVHLLRDHLGGDATVDLLNNGAVAAGADRSTIVEVLKSVEFARCHICVTLATYRSLETYELSHACIMMAYHDEDHETVS